MELMDRLFAKVDASGDCWEWTASRSDEGYGRIKVAGTARQAHRVVYEFLVGPIPAALTIDHLCRNRGCVNPDHLEPVTKAVNDLRGYGLPAQKARRTTCPQGHPYDALNANGKGVIARVCKRCSSAKVRRYKARLRLRAAA